MMAGKIRGMSIVAMRKDLFCTLFRNSRWNINQILYMISSFHQFNKDLTHGWYLFHEAMDLCYFGQVPDKLIGAHLLFHPDSGRVKIVVNCFLIKQFVIAIMQ